MKKNKHTLIEYKGVKLGILPCYSIDNLPQADLTLEIPKYDIYMVGPAEQFETMFWKIGFNRCCEELLFQVSDEYEDVFLIYRMFLTELLDDGGSDRFGWATRLKLISMEWETMTDEQIEQAISESIYTTEDVLFQTLKVKHDLA